jgi:hypothetical protein
MARDDFSEVVKAALGKRASFVCSNPECRVLTIAPADSDATKVLYVGKAAHIHAAAQGGPRYDSAMPVEQRKAIENAIFLCSTCADMIDRNQGADFPAELLRKWKQEHEDWVRANLNRRADSPVSVVSGTHEAHGQGEITALDVQGPAIIKPGTVARASGQGQVTGTRIGPPRKG